MKKYLHGAVRVALLLSLLVIAFTGTAPKVANAATITCPVPCTSDALTTAIASAAAGDVIEVPAGTFDLTAEVVVNKAVTIHGTGAGSTIFNVLGTGYRFSLRAAGATLDNFEIYKGDSASVQNIVYLGASNVTVQNLTMHGQYVPNAGETTRAFESTGGLTGIVIQNNTIYGLRQPGYLNKSSFIIRNNNVYRTKGWAVDGADITFTGNTWGTGTDSNAVDIAIFGSTLPAFYTDILAVSAANNGAVIEDQRSGLLTHVRVNASSPLDKSNGYWTNPYPSIQSGINRVTPGGIVYVAQGTYLENNSPASDLAITKSLSLIGTGSETPVVKLDGAKADGVLINGTDLNVSIRGINFTHRDGSAYGPTNALRFGSTDSTFTGVDLFIVDIGYAAGCNVVFDANGTYSNINFLDSQIHHAGTCGVAVNGPMTGLQVGVLSLDDNGSADPTKGIGLDLGSAGVSNVQIINSGFARNTLGGIRFANTNNAVVDNVYFWGNGSDANSAAIRFEDASGTSSANITISHNTFHSNTGTGVLLAVGQGSTISNVAVESNIFESNSSAAVSNISNGTLDALSVRQNSIINSGNGVTNMQAGTTLLAENNWWGCNEGPGAADCTAVSANVDANPWLMLTTIPEYPSVAPAGTASVIASMKFNSDGDHTSASDPQFPWVSVAFSATGGTMNPTSKYFAQGEAVSTFTAGNTVGKYSVCSTLNNETDCAAIDVGSFRYLPVIIVTH